MMKARTVFKIAALVGVPTTAYFASKGGLKYQQLRSNRNWADRNKKNAAIDAAKAYWPAFISGGLTMGSILLLDSFYGKELLAVGAVAVAAISSKEEVEYNFKEYRNAVKEDTVDGGPEKDIEYAMKVADKHIHYTESGEAVHKFKINWLEEVEPIYFDATFAQVGDGIHEINKRLMDFLNCDGLVKMPEALELISGAEHWSNLIKEQRDIPVISKAGWLYELLNIDCDCYFLDWTITKVEDEPGVYEICPDWGPWLDLEEYIEEETKAGRL